MEQAICEGYVQTDGDGNPICTLFDGTPIAWSERPYSDFWHPVLSNSDVAELLGATALVFAITFAIRVLYGLIRNR